MPAECSAHSMRFARLKGCDVVADFGGAVMTSDAGEQRAMRCGSLHPFPSLGR